VQPLAPQDVAPDAGARHYAPRAPITPENFDWDEIADRIRADREARARAGRLSQLPTADVFEPRQNRYADALEKNGLEKKAQRHRECNRTWNKYACSECSGSTFSAVATCRLRTCLSCQARQSKELHARVAEKLDAAKKTRGFRLRLITLTVQTNGLGDMARAIGLLGEALPKLWRKVLKRKSAGAMFAMEAGEARGNIHVHGLYWGPWVDQRELSHVWSELTGACVVDVRLARGDAAAREVCKYVCSPLLPIAILTELESALQGKRRIRMYGCFFGSDDVEEPETPGRSCPACGVVGCLTLIATTLLSEGRSTGPP
jgi:hypothetical protein